MALPRHEVSTGLVEELGRFEALIRPLSVAEWETPSRCAGWTVGDVARHVIGSLADVVSGQLDGLGTPEVTAREVAERSGQAPSELADECATVAAGAAQLLAVFDEAAWAAPAPGGFDGSLGDGVEALWYDTWLHADDIRASLGRPSEPGDSLRAGVSHVAFELGKRGWDHPVPTDPGDAFAFVLAATGRLTSDAADAPPNIYAV